MPGGTSCQKSVSLSSAPAGAHSFTYASRRRCLKYSNSPPLLCRSREKADRFRKEYGICAVTDDREVMDSGPDFIVSAVSENSIADTAAKWASLGFPVLSETPAGLSVEQLEMLWNLYENSGCRIQIAEQYPFYPRYDAMIRLVQSGILGEPVSLDISAMHGCHAASMIRHRQDIFSPRDRDAHAV